MPSGPAGLGSVSALWEPTQEQPAVADLAQLAPAAPVGSARTAPPWQGDFAESAEPAGLAPPFVDLVALARPDPEAPYSVDFP